MYHVFHRKFWKKNPDYPGGKEPSLGRKYTINHVATEEGARAICKHWNANHDPGFLSDKAEFQEL